METFDKKKEVKKKFFGAKTYPIPFVLDKIENNISIKTNALNGFTKEQIINKGFKLHSQGNLSEAIIYYKHCILKGFNDHRIFSNYAVILKSLGRLDEAETYTRKAIEINPYFYEGYSNLGNILRDLGKLKEAEFYTRKAIEMNSNFADGYFTLGNILIDLGKLKDAEESLLKAIELKSNFASAYFSLSSIKNYIHNIKTWQNKLFSKSILKNQSDKDKINIFFARANILHKEGSYEKSSKYLTMANNLKLFLNPSKPHDRINKSKILLIESDKKAINKKGLKNSLESIFIVGMPRSGSTLLESILGMNNKVDNLGEINNFEESFLEWKKEENGLSLAEIYWKKSYTDKIKSNITTNKYLSNYQYVGIIAMEIPNTKIIHCYRNPLDNILSIYRANFSRGNQYSSSLVDCTKIYLDQEKTMIKYKKRFRSKIYDLNYDKLVKDPNKEIKDLISWLGWNWHDSYLSPHLNPRPILTASNVQVRSPINSKSIGVWKNYKDMLQPAIEILTKTNLYRDLIS